MSRHLTGHHRILICLLALALINVNNAAGQSIGVVTGKVIDAKTKGPVPFATVFFASSMIGTTADAEGNYKLEKIPYGKYDLTVSSVGYLLATFPLEVKLPAMRVTIPLAPETKQLSEVVVQSNNKDYARHLKAFKKYFLGETFNASKCTIKNIDKIDLGYDDESMELTVDCNEPIIIENLALGYRIYYHLQQFTLNYKAGLCFVSGIPRFEFLTALNKTQARRWPGARDRAYHGSMLHFMRALHTASLTNNNFLMSLLTPIRDPMNSAEKGIVVRDTLYATSPMTEAQLFALPANAHPKIQIVYTAEPEEPNFRRGVPGLNNRRGVITSQTSFLSFTRHPLVIYDNGYYEDPLTYFSDGYLGWSTTVAELLPYEYQPGSRPDAAEALEDTEAEGTIARSDNDGASMTTAPADSTTGPETPSGLGAISGMITDIHGAPLKDATVWLANSLMSGRSDDDGAYAIREIPNGNYALIVTAPNRRPVRSIVSLKGKETKFTWRMEAAPRPEPMNEVQRDASERIFRRYVCGTTDESHKCLLKNIETVATNFDKASQTMTVIGKSPLDIDNRALGYHVICDLERFDFDFSRRSYAMQHVDRLEELQPLNPAEKKQWEAARLHAYKGSFRHFIDCLTARTLQKNKYDIFLKEGTRETPVNEALIFSKGDEPLRLKVLYYGQPSELAYTTQMKGPRVQTSYITVTKKQLEAWPKDHVQSLAAWEAEGYFSWRSTLATLLPLSYTPENKN